MNDCLEFQATACRRLPSRGSVAAGTWRIFTRQLSKDDTYFADSCYLGFTKTATESTQESGRWALSFQQSEEEIWLLEEAKEVGIDAKHFTREQTQLGNGDTVQMGLWPH